MRGRGLLVRQGNEGSDDDRRGSTVELTDGGRAALELAAPRHVELVRSAVFDGMSAAQLRAFGAVAAVVAERLTTSPPRRT
jgi:DNA-binding MarR family transcriptional regulator